MKRLIILLLVCTGMASMALAQPISYPKTSAELMAWMTAPPSEDSIEVYDNYGYISTATKSKWGIPASALVPGAGQLYAGSWIKGALFIGAEAAGWVLLNKYDKKGDDIKTEFRAYAIDHWSYARYTTYHDEMTEPHTHELSEDADDQKVPVTQQDFEMIGKYDQFKKGWDDFDLNDPNASARTPNRTHYESRRNASNQEYKRMENVSYLIVLNHALSALDAAWTIGKYNREVHTALRMQMRQFNDSLEPMYSLQVSW